LERAGSHGEIETLPDLAPWLLAAQGLFGRKILVPGAAYPDRTSVK
jgi:hypothetical protein